MAQHGAFRRAGSAAGVKNSAYIVAVTIDSFEVGGSFFNETLKGIISIVTKDWQRTKSVFRVFKFAQYFTGGKNDLWLTVGYGLNQLRFGQKIREGNRHCPGLYHSKILIVVVIGYYIYYQNKIPFQDEKLLPF